jgi:hypothetical protein
VVNQEGSRGCGDHVPQAQRMLDLRPPQVPQKFGFWSVAHPAALRRAELMSPGMAGYDGADALARDYPASKE